MDCGGNCQAICEPSRQLWCKLWRGHSSAFCEKFPANCPDTSRQLLGNCPDASPNVARMIRWTLRGRCADVAPDATPDVARTLRRTLRRMLRGNCAEIARLLLVLRPYLLIRGWCHPKIRAFKFQKAARNHVSLNVSNWVMIGALNGRSETGSETEQVGSGMNGRRRSYAWFWNDR